MAGTVRYDGETGTYYAKCDWSELDPSMAVVEVVAEALDLDAVDVPQLYGTIDPDALDLLVASDRESVDAATAVTFEHAGCHVTVDAVGRVEVGPVQD